jgi:hypothetical protein
MTPTLEEFAARLAELEGAPREFAYSEGPPPVARIAARHDAVGDLKIYDDGDELTIEIGLIHHTHVACYSLDRFPESERLGMVAREAAQFVYDVVRDRVVVTVHFIGNRCTGSSSCYVDNEDVGTSSVRELVFEAVPGERRSQRFVWSGPIG